MFEGTFLRFGIPGSREHRRRWFLEKGVFLLVRSRRFSQETLENEPFVQPPVREGPEIEARVCCHLSKKRRSPEVLREAPAVAAPGAERRKHPRPGQKWSDSVEFRGGGFQLIALEIHVCLLLAGGGYETPG